ncbi:DUF4918 family protein [Chitinophagaceae bacterium LB-8]|uniref:DUF4918 family protein n=1 Tax=Paraflavisolibacter caeni TaxID=2982496 RepID=A0A9X2Y0K3_9BACT|nr:uracil-DNA glycosylase family protein [Paraflavisolibacter caeni]MCU7552376.1 DUF4918 family protein [Paraflavisolibacter caeni]
MQTWADFLLHYYTSLQPPDSLPNDVQWLFPQKEKTVQEIIGQFFRKFYNDSGQRILWLGINPGRFGAGVTGVNFTAPRQLSQYCGIEHPFKSQSEISAEFIYSVIEQYGGAELFYHHYFIGSVCPLGFVQHGKNINYYDDKQLLQKVEPFIVDSLQRLVSFNINRQRCICVGGEKNFRYLNDLNEKYNWFDEIIPLPHPRFVMQYKRKSVREYVDMYLKAIS